MAQTVPRSESGLCSPRIPPPPLRACATVVAGREYLRDTFNFLRFLWARGPLCTVNLCVSGRCVLVSVGCLCKCCNRVA